MSNPLLPPIPYQTPLTDKNGIMSPTWTKWFNQLYQRTGQANAPSNLQILISPMTSVGDMIYGGSAGAATNLPGNTTSTKKFLTQTGTGTASAAPGWNTIATSDVPTLNQNTTGTASNVTGTVAIANGGTGQTAKTAAFDALQPMTTSGDIIYGGASGTGTRLPKGTNGQVLTLASGLPSWAAAGGGGMIGTNWASDKTFTPNGFGTLASSSFFYRRVGDSMEVRFEFVAGTVAASTSSITLPNAIDSAKMSSSTNGTMLATWTSANGASQALFDNHDFNNSGIIFYDGSDTSNVYFAYQGGGTSTQYNKVNGSTIFTSGGRVSACFTIPISGWSWNA